MSVTKRMPPDSSGDPHRIVAVDLSTGAYEEINAPGRGPRVSADGKHLAYWVRGADNESLEAWIKDLGRDAEPRFLAYGHVKAWLKDNNELLLTDVRRAENKKDMFYSSYFLDASGTNRRDLKLPSKVYIADCTADGKTLLVGGIEGWQLHLMPTDGGKPTRVSPPDEAPFSGRISPDGGQVAFVVYGNPKRVMTVNRDGSNPREVYRGEGLTDLGKICWSPDGEYLAVVLSEYIMRGRRRIKSTSPKDDHNYRVLILDKDGKHPRPLVLEGLSVQFINELDWK